MEVKISEREALVVIDVLLHPLAKPLEFGDLRLAGALGGKRACHWFDRAPELEQRTGIFETGGSSIAPCQHIGIQEIPVAPLANTGADPWPRFHHSLAGENLDHFPQNSPTDPVGCTPVI